MTDFLKNEFKKCLDTLEATSPASPDYAYILQNISFLDSCGQQIETIIDLSRSVVLAKEGKVLSFTDPPAEYETAPATEEPVEAPTPAPAPAKEAKSYTKAELRKALYNAKKKGFDVVDIYQKYGVNNINDLPESAYAEIVEEYIDAK